MSAAAMAADAHEFVVEKALLVEKIETAMEQSCIMGFVNFGLPTSCDHVRRTVLCVDDG